MKDAAGNYIFEYEGYTYKIMRMGWREQREFIKVFKDIFTDTNELIPFTDEFNNAQDWLLPKIAHVDNGLQYLKDDYLESHLEKFKDVPIHVVTGIFSAALSELSLNFFPKGSDPNNSNQNAETSLENTDYQTTLSKTFN